MAIQVEWDDQEQHIVRWRFIGHWTLDDLIKAAKFTERRFLDEATQPIDFIIDVTHGGLIPPRLMPFARGVHVAEHPLEGMKIFVGADRYLHIFFAEFSRYAPAHWDIRFAESYEDARAIIRAQRPTLLRS